MKTFFIIILFVISHFFERYVFEVLSENVVIYLHITHFILKIFQVKIFWFISNAKDTYYKLDKLIPISHEIMKRRITAKEENL